MSNIVVIAFDDMNQAAQLRAQLKHMQTQGDIHIDDAAIVVKDEAGQVSVQDEAGRKLTHGIVAGGVLLPLILITFPVAGLALGAGAVVGMSKVADKAINTEFITQLSESLKPGNSALFLLVHDANRDAVEAALRPFRGRVLQSNLAPEAEEALKQALNQFE
jgi:uncharacterized membrane protein